MKIKVIEKNIAIELRREGATYSEILKKIKVSKSTLLIWLKEVGLAKDQKQRITQKRINGRLRALDIIRKNKIKRVADIKMVARSEVPELIKDAFWLTGVILYLGEGSKEHRHAVQVEMTNMDINVHKIFVKWAKRYLLVTDEQFQFEVFIHENANIEAAKVHWSKELGFQSEILKVYLKRHNPKTKRTNVGLNYYGVLKISLLQSIPLNRKIAGWIEGVVVYLSTSN